MSTEHTPETPEHFQARSVLVRAIAGYRDGVGPDCAEIAALIAERDKLTAERDKLRAERDTLTHQVIACGVAATHPDANLTRTGAYAEKWDSAQAEQVRALRAERDKLREARK